MSTSERTVPGVIFLPGILMPAALRYERLLDALGDDVDPVVKELEVYRGPSTPPPGYSLEVELAGSVARPMRRVSNGSTSTGTPAGVRARSLSPPRSPSGC